MIRDFGLTDRNKFTEQVVESMQDRETKLRDALKEISPLTYIRHVSININYDLQILNCEYETLFTNPGLRIQLNIYGLVLQNPAKIVRFKQILSKWWIREHTRSIVVLLDFMSVIHLTELQPFTNVEFLEIRNKEPYDLSLFRGFLKLVPNVEVVNLIHSTIETLRILVEECRNLKALRMTVPEEYIEEAAMMDLAGLPRANSVDYQPFGDLIKSLKLEVLFLSLTQPPTKQFFDIISSLTNLHSLLISCPDHSLDPLLFVKCIQSLPRLRNVMVLAVDLHLDDFVYNTRKKYDLFSVGDLTAQINFFKFWANRRNHSLHSIDRD